MTTKRIRPVTATEVARKLMERPSAAESVTGKFNQAGDLRPEVTAVRESGESLMDTAGRMFDVFEYVLSREQERQAASFAERNDDGNGGTPFD